MKRNNKQIILYLLPQRTPLQMVLILTIYVVTLKKKKQTLPVTVFLTSYVLHIRKPYFFFQICNFQFTNEEFPWPDFLF